jgi:DNA repair protein SbcD/Mre11
MVNRKSIINATEREKDMRIFHTGDIHVCTKHRYWVIKALKYAIDTAISEGCTLAVLPGDLFDGAINAHEPAFAEFVEQMIRLGSHMEVAAMYGTLSHDRTGSLDFLRALPTRFPIHVIDRPAQIMTKAGVLVSALPGLNKADPEIQSVGAKAWARGVLEGFAEQNRATTSPALLMVHGDITGATTESQWALVSPDHELDLESLASAEADAVCANHIHKMQAWPNVRTPSGATTTIAYSGSLARLVHGHLEPVGFLIWDVEPGRADFRFFESPARKLVQIDFPGPPDLGELRAIADTVGPDDAVRIRWTVDAEHATQIDKGAIRAMFASAESIQIEPTVLPIQRVRAEGIGKAMTLADKLCLWAETTGSEHALSDMTDRLAMLAAMDPEAIVAEISK